MRRLGHLGEQTLDPRDGRRRRRRAVLRAGAGYVRPRPLVPTRVLWGLVLTAVALAYLGFSASSQSAPAAAGASRGPEAAEVGAAAGASTTSRLAPRSATSRSARTNLLQPTVFGAVRGLELGTPHERTALIGFHEASHPEALPLTPVGRLRRNDNPFKFVPGVDQPGPTYVILGSRDRPRPATSAVDIVIPRGGTVTAPVTGRVVEVREYVLYGRLRDWRVVIEPRSNPELHVVLIHLEEPSVRAGDEVRAGVTPLATVRQLPFASQVDRYLESRQPHAHLEVKPAARPSPLDPNAPALQPDSH